MFMDHACQVIYKTCEADIQKLVQVRFESTTTGIYTTDLTI